MRNKVKLGSAAAAALASVGGSADASMITLNLSMNQLLTSGTSYAGSFDISSFLAPSNGYDHVVSSALLTAYGYSDAQFVTGNTTQDASNYAGGYSYQTGAYFVQTGGGYYVSGYTGGSWWSGYYYVPGYYVQPTGYQVPVYAQANSYNAYSTTSRTDQIVDSMIVDVGEGTGVGSVGAQPAVLSNYNYVNTTQTGNYYAGYVTTANYNRTSSSGYYGALSAIGTLSAADLAAANSLGLVNFTVLGNNGAVTLQGATLSLAVDDVVSAAPEPMTWAMMLVGFGLVGAAMRRRESERAEPEAA